MDNQALINQLIVDEDIRLKPYSDTKGKITIGVGRNLTDKGITHDEALILLNDDINDVCLQLDAKLPWWRHMSEVRQQALANMCFNLGISGLLSFHETLNHLHGNEYDIASKTMLSSLWAKQVGQRAVRLSAMIANG